jgi:hypothetical protein
MYHHLTMHKNMPCWQQQQQQVSDPSLISWVCTATYSVIGTAGSSHERKLLLPLQLLPASPQ